MAKYMKNNVPGMDVPDYYIERIKGVPKKKRAKEGIQIAVEQIEEFKEMKGVAGVHLMAIEWEKKVPAIVEAAGLLPRPEVTAGAADAAAPEGEGSGAETAEKPTEKSEEQKPAKKPDDKGGE